jgi:hypothetical protein
MFEIYRLMNRDEFVESFLDDLKERISIDRVHKYLPFGISVKSGENFNHIINEGIYSVRTESRVVREDESLCGRQSDRYGRKDSSKGTCPGCIAIARGLAVRDLDV